MQMALGELSSLPDFVLIDAMRLPRCPLSQKAIIHGDALSLSIACASIIAKVARDRSMIGAERRFEGYGFAHNKGYATRAHLEPKGYLIRARNFRCREGEIDIVAQDGETLVFVEVRTRRGDAMGDAAESVPPAKEAGLVGG